MKEKSSIFLRSSSKKKFLLHFNNNRAQKEDISCPFVEYFLYLEIGNE